MPEWFEDGSFWATLYPVMFPPERFQLAGHQVDQIVALSGVGSGAVLDLCCGPGRHSVEFARRGFVVTGVDRTPFLLAEAKAQAADPDFEIEWVEEDMRRFVRPGAFDLAVNLFTSFGYFDDKNEDLRVLRNVHESLRPGGTFVIDVIGKECLARVFRPMIASDGPDGRILVQRHEIFDDWSRIRNEWILVDGDRVHRFAFHHTVYSAQELKDLLAEAGFSALTVYGDLDGSPYGPEAQRLVAVARR